MKILYEKVEHIVDNVRLPKLIYTPSKENGRIRFTKQGKIDTSNVNTEDAIVRLIVDRVGLSMEVNSYTNKYSLNLETSRIKWDVMSKVSEYARTFLDVNLPQKHPRVTHLYRWVKKYVDGGSSNELTNDILLWYSYIANYNLALDENKVHVNNGIALLQRIKEKYEHSHNMQL